MRERKWWVRLDNAAKIFPPNTTTSDTKVFRAVCELKEIIDKNTLQSALDKAMLDFPMYRSTLKKGLFWYYFEESHIHPLAEEESNPICASLYNSDRPGLLFRVFYYEKRINIEIFHALADGNGAFQFLRTLVFYYLQEKYNITSTLTISSASYDQKIQDAFYKYYDKSEKTIKNSHMRAYKIKGERLPNYRLGVTEGIMSLKRVIKEAHNHNATLSEFLVAIFIRSIYEGMAVRERIRPVVISVPVDLRRFFPAQTVRNFFCVVKISHNFQTDGQEFQDIIANVSETLKHQLTADNLSGIISRFSSIESNLFIKAVPLGVKIPVLALSGKRARDDESAAFSNIGKISMPKEMTEYIHFFDVYTSTKRPEICLCSFEDVLALSVSSPLADTGIPQRFFNTLAGFGIPMKITDNRFPDLPEAKSPISRALLAWSALGSVSAAAVCVSVNMTVPSGGWWSLFVIAGFLSLWADFGVILKKRRNLPKSIIWQVLMISAIAFVWDISTGYKGWSIDYVFPLISSGAMFALTIVPKVRKMDIQDYILYLVIACALGLISFALILTKAVNVKLPSAVSFASAIVFLAFLLFFEGKALLAEFHRRFHL